MRVQDLFIRDVATCHLETPLRQVGLLMRERTCGAIPVLDHRDRVVGMVTDRDMALSLAASDHPATRMYAGDILSRPAHTILRTATLREALQAMHLHRVRRMPVVDADGVLCGLLSLTDLILAAEDPRLAGPDALTYPELMELMKALAADTGTLVSLEPSRLMTT